MGTALWQKVSGGMHALSLTLRTPEEQASSRGLEPSTTE